MPNSEFTYEDGDMFVAGVANEWAKSGEAERLPGHQVDNRRQRAIPCRRQIVLTVIKDAEGEGFFMWVCEGLAPRSRASAG